MTVDREYESREIHSFLRQLSALEKLPLRERKENTAELYEILRDNPALFAERVGWVLNGSYGYGAYVKAREIARSPRMNRAAALTSITAGLEWSVPGRMVAVAWKRLTKAQQERLDKYLQKEIQDHLAEDSGAGRSRTRRRPAARRKAPARRRR